MVLILNLFRILRKSKMAKSASTAKTTISIDGFFKYMMSWFDSDKWSVNSTNIMVDSLKWIKPYFDAVKSFTEGEWFSTVIYLLILLIVIRIGYRSIICPLYCLMWRFLFCFIDSGRRSVNYHKRHNDDYYL
jgi:hypothetical protein